MTDNIHVSLRFRPVSDTDTSTHDWDVTSTRVEDLNTNKVDAFARVFEPSSGNAEVYDVVGLPIVESVLQGFNGTIFAYGQTNSGKTHTIYGYGAEEPGIVPRALRDMFASIAQRREKELFLVRVSMMEIYNEKVFDLLDEQHSRKELKVRAVGGVFEADGAREVPVQSVEDVERLLKLGNDNRSVGVSNLNEHSSRSHSIFRLKVENAVKMDGDGEGKKKKGKSVKRSKGGKTKLSGAVKVSELNIVDLAGSETLVDTFGAAQQSETKAINLSLTMLKSVIMALSKQAKFVPYRNSTLTKILKNSLGGNAKTALVCTASADPQHQAMTRSTIYFGSIAEKVTNRAKVNEVLDDNERVLLRQFKKKVGLLEERLQDFEEVQREKRELQESFLRLQAQMRNLKAREDEQTNLREEVNAISRMVAGNAEDDEWAEPDAGGADEVTEEQLSEMQTLLSEIQQQNTELEDQLAKQRESVERAQREIAEKQQALAAEREQAEERDALLRELEREKEAQSSKLDEVEQLLQQKQDEMNANEALLQEKLAALEAKQREAEEHNRALHDQNREMEQEMQAKMAVLEQERERAERMEETIVRLEEQKDRMAEQEQEQSDRLEQLKRDIAESGMDRDEYLAQLIHHHDEAMYELRKAQEAEISRREAERLALHEELLRMHRELQRLKGLDPSVPYDYSVIQGRSGAGASKRASASAAGGDGADAELEPGEGGHVTRQAPQLSESELTERQKALLKGGPLKKHGRKGTANEKYVCISDKYLIWANDRQSAYRARQALINHGTVPDKCVAFGEVREVLEGKETDVLRRWSAKLAKRAHCFSLVTDDRTVDFEASTALAAQNWVIGLRAVIFG